MIWIGLLFTISAIGSALAPDPYSFSFFRFIGGIGIGVSSVAAPTYISEISTPATRGRLGALYQFNIVFGILVAFLSNYFLEGFGGDNDWRYMLGVMAIPSIIYSILVFGVPESPRWLIAKRNDVNKAKVVMSKLGVQDVEGEAASIVASKEHETKSGKGSGIFGSKYSTIMWLAFLMAFSINGQA